MILRTLHLENYKQYGALDLEFREGLIGIIGRNGAGKSTIFEAILYCLFGKDESNKTLIRSSFADPKSNVVLSLQFAVGPVEYAVKREFRGRAMAVNAELYKNDQFLAKGVAQVNEEIAKILNMERDAFKRSVFSGQKELSELSEANGESRKKMVRKMLGLDTLDDIQTRVNTDARDLGNQIAGQRQNLLDPEVAQVMETEIAAWETQLEQNAAALKTEQKKLDAIEEQYNAEKQKFDAEEKRLAAFNRLNLESGQLRERLARLAEQSETLESKKTELHQQKEKLDSARSGFNQYLADKKQLDQLEPERQRKLNYDTYSGQIRTLEAPLTQSRNSIQTLEKELDGKAKLDAALQQSQAFIQDLEKSREAKLAERDVLLNRKSEISGLIKERKTKVDSLMELGRSGTCPTCLQPLLEGFEKAIAQLKAEIDAMQTAELTALEKQEAKILAEGLDIKTKLGQARTELSRLQAEQSRLNELSRQKNTEENNLNRLNAEVTKIQLILQKIGEIHFDETHYQALKTRIAAEEPHFQEFSKDDNYVNRELPATLANLQKSQTAIAETKQQIAEQTKQLQQLKYDPQQYEAVKQVFTRSGESYRGQLDQVRNLERSGMELQNNAAQLREKLRANERIREQVSAKLAEVELLKKLGELLLQFKTEILEKVSPSISSEASALFSRITKGKYERIHVDENFDFAIADGGQLYPIERFSGGEVDLANFCLRIAITKAIMNLSGSGQGVEFLAFDEIFGSQDEERRHEMMLALHYLQEQFRQIYIVSHIESQKDYFPNLLEVTYKPEGSSVKWV